LCKRFLNFYRDLFHPYNTKKKEGEKVYKSLNVLQNELGGLTGLAKTLVSSLTVSSRYSNFKNGIPGTP